MEQTQAQNEGAHSHARPGVVGALAAIARNSVGLLVSRIELAAVELGEVRDNVARLLFVGALGIVAVLFALGCWTALLVVLAWPSMGWAILLLVALFYTLAAAAVLMYLKRFLAQDNLSLPATLAELRKDRDALL